jgi:hypothetical protein
MPNNPLNQSLNPLLLKIYPYYLLFLPYNLSTLRRSLIRNNPLYIRLVRLNCKLGELLY